MKATNPWPEVLAAALVGSTRSGVTAEALLDTVAAQGLRRRAGVALVPGVRPPAPAPPDEAPPVGPAAAVRADALLALDRPSREATPVRDMAARLELLAEWLSAAAGRRLPAELVPALLEAGRRHRELRPLIAPVAGPLAGWLAEQRPEWGYATAPGPASAGPRSAGVQRTAVTNEEGAPVDAAWELGSIGHRVAYLRGLRGRDPGHARELLAAAWAAEAPDDRAALLGALGTGLGAGDEPLLESALDDRRRQVRAVAVDLLARLPDSAYARRMADRAAACVDLSDPGRIDLHPPTACDRSMVRDGIAPRPPAGTGERAWWLEEILARTRLSVWPEPHALLARRMSDDWVPTVRRGLARAAATQRDGGWAAALVDPLTAEVAAHGQPNDRLLLEALYDVLPPEDLTLLATAVLSRGLAEAAAVGVEHVLSLCPRPWPAAVGDAVLRAVAEQLGQRAAGWRVAGLCELAALRLPAGFAARTAALAERMRAARPNDPAVAVVERLAATIRFRHDMLEELR